MTIHLQKDWNFPIVFYRRNGKKIFSHLPWVWVLEMNWKRKRRRVLCWRWQGAEKTGVFYLYLRTDIPLGKLVDARQTIYYRRNLMKICGKSHPVRALDIRHWSIVDNLLAMLIKVELSRKKTCDGTHAHRIKPMKINSTGSCVN